MSENMSAIDKAINAANARKAMKAAASANGESPASSGKVAGEADFTKATEVTPKAEKVKAEKQNKDAEKSAKDAERAAKKAQLDADRAERKAKRDAERSEKKAARADKQTNKVAHMSKVEKAAAKLPSLNETATTVFTDITTNFSRSQIAALAEHLAHFNRAQATARALNTKLEVGDTVRITGGDPRYAGKVGTLDKVQRIRCYCKVEGVEKPIYLFTSDVSKLEPEQIAVAV